MSKLFINFNAYVNINSDSLKTEKNNALKTAKLCDAEPNLKRKGFLRFTSVHYLVHSEVRLGNQLNGSLKGFVRIHGIIPSLDLTLSIKHKSLIETAERKHPLALGKVCAFKKPFYNIMTTPL